MAGPTRFSQSKAGYITLCIAAVAAIAIGLYLRLVALPSAELQAQANSAPTSSGVWPGATDSRIVTMQAADFDAEVEDITPNYDVYAGQTVHIAARFKNLSPSTGPHGGDATFDLTIYVEPPSGTATRFSWDNEAFTLNQEMTFGGSYTFASAGAYTVWAEVYDINGQQSGWNADNRFDQRIETLTVLEPVIVQISPSSYTVNEDVGEIEFTVTLSESLPRAAEVTLKASVPDLYGGSRPWSTTVAFPPDTTSQTKSVTVVDDDALEATRQTFYVVLDVGRDPRLSVNPLQMETSVTIVDDDEVTVRFQSDEYIVNESGGQSFRFCLQAVSRSRFVSVVPFTVHFSYTDPYGDLSSPPATAVAFRRSYRVSCVGRFEINNDNVVEDTHTVEFTLDSVTSDSPGVADRILFGENPRALLRVTDPFDTAFVEFEHREYSVSEGSAVELCAVLRYDTRVEFPFTVNLSYMDPDGELSSGPTAFRFEALDAKSCVEFQTQDDDVWSGASVVYLRLTRPTDLDRRISISGSRVRLTINDDDSPANSAPSVARSSPTQEDVSIPTGLTQTFMARATDPDDNLESFEWFVNDVSQDGQSPALTGDIIRRFSHRFAKPGSYTVKATFTDSNGLSDSVSWDVDVKGPDLTTCPATPGSAQ